MSLFLMLLVFLGCFLAGERLLLHLGKPLAEKLDAETAVLATALGIILVALFTLALCATGTLYPIAGWSFLAILYLSNFPGLLRLKQAVLESPNRITEFRKQKRGWFYFVLLSLLIFLFGIFSLNASLPPTGQDSLVYHLAVPKAYLENHGFLNLPNNKYSFFPLLFEMVYLFGMMLQMEPLPQDLGFWTALLMFSGLNFYGARQLGLKYFLLPSALFFSTPTFLEGTANAYIDIPAACFIFFAWISWDIWRREKKTYRFYLLCIFSAAAVTTKLTVLPVIALGVLGITWVGRQQKASYVLKLNSIYLLTTLVFVLPWWIRNFLYTGNPVAPFLMQYLGGDNINWDSDRTAMIGMLLQQGTGRGLFDFLMVPWSVTFNAVRGGLPFDGDIGIVWLIASPALLFVPWRGDSLHAQVARPLGVVLFVFAVFWFIYFQQIRFLAAPFVLLSILLAIGIERMIAHPNPISKSIPWILAGGLLFNTVTIFNYWSEKKPWQALTENRAAYLARVLPPYPVYNAMNHELNPTDKALFIYMRNFGYLADVPFHSDSFFEAHTAQQILSQHADPASIKSAFRNRGFTHLMFDNRFVFGKDTAFQPRQLDALKDFLNQYGKLIHSENGFYLYRFVLD